MIRNVPNYRVLVITGILLLSLVGCGKLNAARPVTKRGLVTTLKGHTGGVLSVAFSPDGTILASGSLDTTVRLWNIATGKELATLYGHGAQVNAVPFSPDGRLLASGDGIVWTPTSPLHFSDSDEQGLSQRHVPEDEIAVPFMVILWDLASGMEKVRLKVETPIHTVAFSPDGKTVAAGGGWPDDRRDDAVWMWNVATGVLKEKRRLDIVWSIAFSPDGTMLVTGQMEGITLSDVETGASIASARAEHPIRSVVFSPNNPLIAAGDASGNVFFWDWTTDQKQTVSDKHKGVVDALAFSPDGAILASSGQDGTVHLWDVVTKEVIATIHIPQTWVGGVTFSPDGVLLATGSSDGLVRLWKVAEVLER